MSILQNSNNCSLLDHMDYILSIYKNVLNIDNETHCYGLSAKLFSILSIDKCSQTKSNTSDILHEATEVKLKYKTFLTEIETHVKERIYNFNILNTKEVRSLSRELLERTAFNHIGLNGGNNSDRPVKCKVKDEFFLIPKQSRFYCGCVIEQCHKLTGNKYDLVIADPPWWNKYIRRLKGANGKLSYSMMYNEDIASIPLKDLLATNCLVAVWCTNSPTNIAAVKDVIFKSWGVEYIATWYWLKVTIDLKPLCPFSSGSKKQPYERLIIGKVGDINLVPDGHLIMSVPSALHSHKPPLIDLLKSHVKKKNPEVLELFARYLLPNTTSVGYEPLKWQHISLYEAVS